MRCTYPSAFCTVAALAIMSVAAAACSDGAGPSDVASFADRIVFSYSTDGGDTKLATANPDGSDVREIPLPTSFKSSTIGQIAWTSDHSRILVAASPSVSGHFDLFVVRPTGGTPVNITQTADLDEASATWSPDGEQIAFERNGIISIIDADGSNEHVLVGPNLSNTGNYYPDWSPDGTRIVYSTGYGEGLWTVSTTGSTDPVSIRGAATAGMRGPPTWSPDGSRILFWEVNSTGPGGGQLMTIAPDGSDPQAVSSALIGYGPVWSPDGARIAVIGIQEPNVGFSEFNLATSAITSIELPGTIGSFAWK